MATNSYLKPFILLIIIVANLMGFEGKLWAFVLPQDREEISRQVVDFGSLGDFEVVSDSAVVWDFSHCSVSSDCRICKWRNFGDSVLVRIENGSQWIYRVRHDSIFLESHENKLMSLSDSISPLVGYGSLSLSDGISSPFHFKGKYSGENALTLVGQYSVEAHTYGTLILPDDTLYNVLLTRHINDGILTVSDSHNNKEIDSEDDNLLQRRHETLRWWSENFRHPLLESQIVTYFNGSQLIDKQATALLYSPDAQEYASANTMTPNSQPLPNRQRQKTSATSSTSREGFSSLDNPISVIIDNGVAHVNVNISNLSLVKSGSLNSSEISIVLCDLQGRVYARGNINKAGNYGTITKDINVSGLPSGEYILHVRAGEYKDNTRLHIK